MSTVISSASSPPKAAIDVHGHFGVYCEGELSLIDQWLGGTASEVSHRAELANVRWTIVSALKALMPFRGDVLRGNLEALSAAEKHDNLLFWAVADPCRTETIEQTKELLHHPRCLGIKIHPLQHQYEARHALEPIFQVSAESPCVILTHSGDRGSYPEDFLPWADAYPEAKVILAHLGNGDDGKRSRHVRAIQHAKHSNVWVDTSSASSMLSGLIEWAIAEIGDDRILFGTDAPLYFTACQRTRIECAAIPDLSKQRIFWDNAIQLFGEKLTRLNEKQ
jgi:predicted TIM-barrel fold metal-dependent hydrolase